MINTRIELLNFRNHISTQLEWGSRLNVMSGPNGAGKTSLIDALHFLCMSRSFVANTDAYIVNQDATYFMIKGHFEGQIRPQFDLSFSYSRGEGKKIFVNDSPLERLSDLIGMVPVVVLAPDDKKLTLEGPAERRAYIDSFISQISPKYLRDLLDYRRIRRQRNALLQEFSGPSSVLVSYLEPWDIQLVETGSRIISRRFQVLEKLRAYLEKDYAIISGMDLTTNLKYQTFCEPSANTAEIEEQYYLELEKVRDREIEREQTIVGPHRDEILFFLDDFELRKFGSQGQHRLFAMALKMAQLHYYSDELDDLPILMLDDVFGDLDIHKTKILLQALQAHQGQTFITSANSTPLEKYINFALDENCLFKVKDGKVEQVK